MIYTPPPTIQVVYAATQFPERMIVLGAEAISESEGEKLKRDHVPQKKKK